MGFKGNTKWKCIVTCKSVKQCEVLIYSNRVRWKIGRFGSYTGNHRNDSQVAKLQMLSGRSCAWEYTPACNSWLYTGKEIPAIKRSKAVSPHDETHITHLNYPTILYPTHLKRQLRAVTSSYICLISQKQQGIELDWLCWQTVRTAGSFQNKAWEDRYQWMEMHHWLCF